MQLFEGIKVWILLALLSLILTVGSNPVSTDSTTVDGRNSADNKENAMKALGTGSNCERIIDLGFPPGIYYMDPAFLEKMDWMWGPFEMYCEKSAGVGWTVIQRRGPFGQRERFNTSITNYLRGFGDLNGEFWLGNKWISKLSEKFGPYELRIELEDWNGGMAWAQYSQFRVYEVVGYPRYGLDCDGYTGNATDSLGKHGISSTKVPDCRMGYTGWWFERITCSYTNLNGNSIINNDETGEPFGHIRWEGFGGDRSLKSSKMMIRSKLYRSLNPSKSHSEM